MQICLGYVIHYDFSVSGGPSVIVNFFAIIVVLKDGAVVPLLDLRFKIVICNFIDRRTH